MDELGYGVADLSLLTASFAVAQFGAAPFLGKLADRIGRRPVIAIALIGHVLGNLCYLVATDLSSIVAVRFFQGLLEAGALPAALAAVADLTPARERGRWVGVILAAYGGAFVMGPVFGGALFDLAGFAAPFTASATLGGLGLLLVPAVLGESLTPALRVRNRLDAMLSDQSRHGLAQTLPRPVSTFVILLLAAATPNFVLSYVEPQMMFHAYDVLGWSTMDFGLMIGGYGASLILTQVMLGGISDKKFERRWVIGVGLIVQSTFFWGVTVLTGFLPILLVAAASGVGKGIMTPAVGAFLLDMAAPRQRASVIGLRTSAASMGAIAGPMLTFRASGWMEPTTLFASAGAFVLAVALITAVGLRVKPAPRLEVEAYRLRSLAAGATLRGLVIHSAAARVY